MALSIPRVTRGEPARHEAGDGTELSAKDWAARAVKARRQGAFDLATQCARHAVRLAPFNKRFRSMLTELLYEKLEWERGNAVRQAAAFDDEFDEGEELPERPAPRRRAPVAVEEDDWESRRNGIPPRLFDDEDGEEPRRSGRDGFDRLQSSLGSVRRSMPKPRKSTPWRAVFIGSGLICGVALLIGATFAAGKVRDLLSPHAPGLSGGSSAAALPTSLSEKVTEANRMLTNGSPDRAVTALRELVAANPDHAGTLRPNLVLAIRAEADRQLRRRDPGAAIRALGEATALDPANVDVWRMVGRANMELSKMVGSDREKRRYQGDSETAYRKALDLEKDDPEALLGLGQTYIAMSDKAKATSSLETLQRVAPGTTWAEEADRALRSLKR